MSLPDQLHDGANVYVSPRISDEPVPAVPSRVERCQACDAEVWVNAARPPEVVGLADHLWCARCAVEYASKHPDDERTVAPASWLDPSDNRA